MDDAFRLAAVEMPRRRHISPFGARVAAGAAVIVLLLSSFVMFVVGQQRAADQRRAAALASQAAERAADAQAVATESAPIHASRPVVQDMIDMRARTAAASALDAARRLATTTSIDSADAGALSVQGGDVVFVEGPSTGPSVVSVFASAAGWSAAVQGSAHTCYWIALSPGGATRYGSGSLCTGIAALAADRKTW